MSGVTLGGAEEAAGFDNDLSAHTRRLVGWLASATGGLPVVVWAGGAEPDSDAVVIRLTGLAGEALPRDTGAPLGLMVDYAVTVVAADPFAAHAVLGEIAFLALGQSEIELRAAQPAASGQPTLGLRVTVRRPRAAATPPRVREHLRRVVGGLAALQGVVFGPSEVPIAGAELTIAALGARAITDATGHFQFTALPPMPASIVVVAKGVRLTALANPGERLVIRVPLEV